MSFKTEKELIRKYFDDLDNASDVNQITEVFKKYTSDDLIFKSVYPFREFQDRDDILNKLLLPMRKAITHLQRRQDIFIAGTNEVSDGIWVMSMGHFMGLFDHEWLGVRPNGKLVSVRYAEFNQIKDGKIVHTGLFMDLLGFLDQAGANPLPPSTGKFFMYPGPKDHNGILMEDADPKESIKTKDLVNQMVKDLSDLNDSGAMGCPPEVLAKSWAKDMAWYGPCGIGASYTIERYQKQHQLPFRNNLSGKKFNGHVCRFAEGNFACFFGWPNLTNTPIGGFLGLPGGNVPADMQVVDVYCRKDDKLKENWVLIDIPYWLKQQGLDVFERTEYIFNPSYLK